MLIFLAALQDIPRELEESAALEGFNRRQLLLRYVTLPALRPVLFLVLTLVLISTWQVFDQVYVMGQGAPGNTTLTPAFLSYSAGFDNADFGQGAAIAFVLLALILCLTAFQRWALRERGVREGGSDERRCYGRTRPGRAGPAPARRAQPRASTGAGTVPRAAAGWWGTPWWWGWRCSICCRSSSSW